MADIIDFRVKNGLLVTTTATVEGATQSVSSITGALKVIGGAGIGKSLFVGDSLNVSVGATIDAVRIGVSGNAEIDTTSGNLTLDSTGGTVAVDDNLTVSGGVVVTGDVAVNGGDITTNQATFNLLNSTATTINVGGASTLLTIGANAPGSVVIRNNTNATSTATGSLILYGGLGINRDLRVGGTIFGTFSGDIAGSSTTATNADNIRTIQRSTNATHFLTFVDSNNVANAYEALYTDAGISYNPSTDLLTLSGDIAVNGGDITSSAATFNLLNATVTTANVLGAGTNITIGATTGATTIRNATTVSNTTLSSSTLTGALKVLGGIGANNLFVSNAKIISPNTDGNTAATIPLDVQGAWIRIGDASSAFTQTNGIGIKFHDAGNTHWSIASTGTGFVIAQTSANGDQLLPPTRINALSIDSAGNITGSANITAVGDIAVNGGDVTTNQSVFNLINATATTLNVGSAASTMRIGATSGTLTVGNPTVVGTQASQDLYNTVATTLNVGSSATTMRIGATSGTLTVGNPTVVGTQASQNLYNTVATTLNVGSAATTMRIGATSGTLTVGNPTVVGTQASQDLYNTVATTVNAFGASTTLTLGAVTGSTTIRNNTTVTSTTSATSTSTGALQVRGGAGIAGNLYVGGTVHGTVNSATNLAGGSQMAIVYQSAANTTAFLAAGSAGFLLQTNGTGTAPTWVSATGVSAGSATNADNIRTIRRDTNATHFLTFVDSDNASNAYEALYTDAGISYNPSTNNLTISGDVAVNGGDITSSAATFNLLNATVTTANVLGAGTNITIGATTGATTIRNNTTVTSTTAASSTITGALQVRGGAGIGGALYVGGTIFGNATSANIATTASFANEIRTVSTATAATFYPTFVNSNNATAGYEALYTDAGISYNPSTNDLAISGDLSVAGGDIVTSAAAFNLINTNATTVNIAGAGTTVTIGATTGGTTVRNNLTVAGNLTIQGATTIVDSTVTNITDPILTLGGLANNVNPTVDDAKDRGIAFKWFDTVARFGFFGFDRNTGHLTYVPQATITNEVVSGTKGALDANLAGGSAMALVYQSAANTTAFLSAGTSGQILQTNGTGSAPTWVSISGLSAGTATNADNIRTVARNVSATHFLTFVDSNNASNAYEALYTTSSFSINPATSNVGIGTITPSFPLQIVNATPILSIGNSSSLLGSIYLGNSSHGLNRGGASGANDVSLYTTSGNIYLSANGLATTSHLAVLNNGNVGVGTASPSYKLHITDGVDRSLTSSAAQMSITGSGYQGFFALNATSFQIGQNSASRSLTLHSGTSMPERVRITAAGLVGINTTAPDATLTVNGVASFAAGAAALPSIARSGDLNTGLWFPAADTIAASTAGVERLRITSTGNVGLGVTTPQYRLDVNSGGAGFQASFGSTISSGAISGIHFGYSETANQSYRKSAIVFERQDGSARGKIHILNNGANSAASATLADAKMTIQFDGNVGIGTTSTTNKFEVAGTAGQLFSISDTFTGTIFSVNDVSGIPSIEVIDTGLVKIAQYSGQVTISTATAVVGSALTVFGTISTLGPAGEIRASNEITAYFSSDARLKENVTVISNPIEMVKQIRGVYFDWTDEHIARRGGEDGYFVRKHDVGVIAQEIEQVLPEVVGTREDGFKAVKYDKIVALLVEAVKEQQQQIDALKKLLEK